LALQRLIIEHSLRALTVLAHIGASEAIID